MSVFDKDGACTCHLGSKGSANGQLFSSPYGIAVRHNGIYIADSNKRVQIF